MRPTPGRLTLFSIPRLVDLDDAASSERALEIVDFEEAAAGHDFGHVLLLLLAARFSSFDGAGDHHHVAAIRQAQSRVSPTCFATCRRLFGGSG